MGPGRSGRHAAAIQFGLPLSWSTSTILGTVEIASLPVGGLLPRIHAMVPARVLVPASLLVALAGCDRLSEAMSGGSNERAQAKSDDATEPVDATKPGDAKSGDATEPDAAKPVADAAKPVEPASPPTPAEPAAPPPSEFEGLLVRVSEVASPSTLTDPNVDAVNKGAWAHYKAGRHAEAAREFARVAARDSAWKHAHNLACASAKAGRLDDVRIALAESFVRGGDAAKASAKKDGDLAEARKQAWFDALLSGPVAPAPTGEDEYEPRHPWDEGPGDVDPEDWEDESPPLAKDVPSWASTCPPQAPDDHYCWHDLFGNFQYTAVVFDKPIPLELEVPARPSKQTWTPAKGKISMKDIRAALGIQHTIDSYAATDVPTLMLNESGPFEEDGSETKPFFWWPDPSTPVLVMVQKQKVGAMRFVGVILARKTESGWLATNLEVVSAAQDIAGSNMIIESTVAMRSDGLELLTLSQQTCCEDQAPDMRRLCRISFEEGRLAQACDAEYWRPIYDL